MASGPRIEVGDLPRHSGGGLRPRPRPGRLRADHRPASHGAGRQRAQARRTPARHQLPLAALPPGQARHGRGRGRGVSGRRGAREERPATSRRSTRRDSWRVCRVGLTFFKGGHRPVATDLEVIQSSGDSPEVHRPAAPKSGTRTRGRHPQESTSSSTARGVGREGAFICARETATAVRGAGTISVGTAYRGAAGLRVARLSWPDGTVLRMDVAFAPAWAGDESSAQRAGAVAAQNPREA
jgi:hypothetical protein